MCKIYLHRINLCSILYAARNERNRVPRKGSRLMSHWEPDLYPKVMRDSQRLKAYRSEWALTKVHPEDGLSRMELRCFLSTVISDKWFIDRFGVVTFGIQITKRRKTRSSCRRRGEKFTLCFPDNDKNRRLLALHELTHILVYEQSHGPIFCTLLLQIVTHYLGTIIGHELRRQFGLHGVRLVT